MMFHPPLTAQKAVPCLQSRPSPGPLQTPLPLDASPGDLTTSPRLVIPWQWFLPPPYSGETQQGGVASSLDQGPGSPRLSSSSAAEFQQELGELSAPLWGAGQGDL